MRGTIANGERIAALRAAAGLTQEALAAESGCDVKTVRSAERSKRMDAATLRRIAQRLGVTFEAVVVEDSGDRREANVASVQRFHQAFNARDPEAVADSFLEDGVILVMVSPLLPGAGEHRGRNQILHWAQTCFSTYLAEPVTAPTYDLQVAGESIFVELQPSHVTYLPNGQGERVSLMSEFRIRDGKVAMLRIYVESGVMERMVLAGSSESNV